MNPYTCAKETNCTLCNNPIEPGDEIFYAYPKVPYCSQECMVDDKD